MTYYAELQGVWVGCGLGVDEDRPGQPRSPSQPPGERGEHSYGLNAAPITRLGSLAGLLQQLEEYPETPSRASSLLSYGRWKLRATGMKIVLR